MGDCASGVGRRAADAGEVSDRYVLTAVLFASVLFLAGIATKMPSVRGTRLAVGLSVGMIVLATATMFSLPINVGGLRQAQLSLSRPRRPTSRGLASRRG